MGRFSQLIGQQPAPAPEPVVAPEPTPAPVVAPASNKSESLSSKLKKQKSTK